MPKNLVSHVAPSSRATKAASRRPDAGRARHDLRWESPLAPPRGERRTLPLLAHGPSAGRGNRSTWEATGSSSDPTVRSWVDRSIRFRHTSVTHRFGAKEYFFAYAYDLTRTGSTDSDDRPSQGESTKTPSRSLGGDRPSGRTACPQRDRSTVRRGPKDRRRLGVQRDHQAPTRRLEGGATATRKAARAAFAALGVGPA